MYETNQYEGLLAETVMMPARIVTSMTAEISRLPASAKGGPAREDNLAFPDTTANRDYAFDEARVKSR